MFNFGKFLEMLKQLHLSIPFTDAIKKMHIHSKFLKDILNGKRECDSIETISLPKNCSALIQRKMPPKLKDSGSFSIPCAIIRMQIEKALCDLGASVSVMPLFVYERLSLGDLLPTNVTLQLADRSLKMPIGKIEDVPLRIGKHVFLVDFIVLDMDEDKHVPIILGRPFLATAEALINVKHGKITFKVGYYL